MKKVKVTKKTVKKAAKKAALKKVVKKTTGVVHKATKKGPLCGTKAKNQLTANNLWAKVTCKRCLKLRK